MGFIGITEKTAILSRWQRQKRRQIALKSRDQVQAALKLKVNDQVQVALKANKGFQPIYNKGVSGLFPPRTKRLSAPVSLLPSLMESGKSYWYYGTLLL